MYLRAHDLFKISTLKLQCISFAYKNDTSIVVFVVNYLAASMTVWLRGTEEVYKVIEKEKALLVTDP